MARRRLDYWNLIDRGESPDDAEVSPADEAETDDDPQEKTDSAREAPDSGAGSEPPD